MSWTLEPWDRALEASGGIKEGRAAAGNDPVAENKPESHALHRKEEAVLALAATPRVEVADLVVTQGLGTGGFSCVVQVEEGAGSGRTFALKCIDKVKFSKPKDHLRLQRELKILQLPDSSPFLLRCYTAFESHTTVNFVTEDLGGGDLLYQMCQANEGKFPEAQVRTITSEIVLGLVHLHRNGFIHRDIKVGSDDKR